MSYLIQTKKISLCDAYRYVQACRPQICPNDRFLFNLAQLEVSLGKGTSVRHDVEFSNYEYNNEIKTDFERYKSRGSKGVYRTCAFLHERMKVFSKGGGKM